MSKKRFFFRCLSPFYKRIPFAKFLYWQSRYLTDMGARVLTLRP